MASPAQAFADDGYKFFVAMIEKHLGVTFKGFQSGFGFRPDLILFEETGGNRDTLAVPMDTLSMCQEDARALIQQKIAAMKKSFEVKGGEV